VLFLGDSGGTIGAVGCQQSVCCHCVVAALIIAFGFVGSTGWWQFGQTKVTPCDGLGMGAPGPDLMKTPGPRVR
jgi:hypothetical protein